MSQNNLYVGAIYCLGGIYYVFKTDDYQSYINEMPPDEFVDFETYHKALLNKYALFKTNDVLELKRWLLSGKGETLHNIGVVKYLWNEKWGHKFDKHIFENVSETDAFIFPFELS